MFKRLYDKTLELAKKPMAERWLGVLSFAESTFFPIPPDVMLAPMVLSQRDRAWRLATITTITSVLGGLVGYAIGMFAFEAVEPWLQRSGYDDDFALAMARFRDWGFWFILLAGFTPIPFKVFTITAGVFGMNLPAFVLGSLIGRGARFFLVAALIRAGGEHAAAHLRRWIDWIGWGVIALAGLVALYYYVLRPSG